MKFVWLFAAFILFLSGCSNEEQKPVQNVVSETQPPDVPIAKSDANINIDKDFPPAPVAE
ncbi:hypothetical protein H0N94_00970 [Campylobacter fetus subsp. fetus]|uniref:hypothetical protein n=1 Tax=Campylobacter fetus TaxID=196 RepID=UPI00143D3FA0|nr:hypothetical protein [Campylobacter fetus]MBC3779985.1 hypothetical protein [Campylobacter fetus subsp. fetus]MBC3782847.1 hypothetical protein [Campylobacter fetus subsp. venerealis]